MEQHMLEHESKALLREMGIETPPGRLATSPEEAAAAVRDLDQAAAGALVF